MQLEVNQYLMSQDSNGNPIFAKVIRVNKNTYRIKKLCGEETSISKTNLVENQSWYGYGKTYIPLDKTQITKEVVKNFMSIKALERKERDLTEIKELIGQAKYFLEQVKDIESIEPEEPDPYDDDDDFFDWEAEERGDNDCYSPEEEEDLDD